jgi:hypothetical protein
VSTTQTATCTGSQNRLGYPISGDVTDYGCRDGDVFLSDTLRGRLTIAAENNIVLVGNTTYQTTGAASTDMLGLVANQFVQVYHPVNSSGPTWPASPTRRSTRPCWPPGTPSSCRTTTRAPSWGRSPSTA